MKTITRITTVWSLRYRVMPTHGAAAGQCTPAHWRSDRPPTMTTTQRSSQGDLTF